MERGAYRRWPAIGPPGIRGGRRYQLAGPGATGAPPSPWSRCRTCSASRHPSQVGRGHVRGAVSYTSSADVALERITRWPSHITTPRRSAARTPYTISISADATVGRCLHETRDGSGRMSSMAETRAGSETSPPRRPRPSNASELGFVRSPMVRWLDPYQLVDTAVRVLLSGMFSSYADNRESQKSKPRSRIAPGKPICGWTMWPTWVMGGTRRTPWPGCWSARRSSLTGAARPMPRSALAERQISGVAGHESSWSRVGVGQGVGLSGVSARTAGP